MMSQIKIEVFPVISTLQPHYNTLLLSTHLLTGMAPTTYTSYVLNPHHKAVPL